ncbi:MAG TPA: hypothetical protein VM290_05635 [Gaiellaceae bacterium]|jgi:hypothetical protein|nr:hypothetical protein [Gaiellaceae bacterium]
MKLRTSLTLLVATTASVIAGVALASADNATPSELYDEHVFASTKGGAMMSRTVVDGQVWEVGRYTSRAGFQCIAQRGPGDANGDTCTPADAMFADGRRVFALFGASHEPGAARDSWTRVWVYGIAAPSVATIEIVAHDCSRSAAKISGDRTFLHVAAGAALRRGRVPYRLVAHDRAGRTIFERAVDVGSPDGMASAPPPTPIANRCSR